MGQATAGRHTAESLEAAAARLEELLARVHLIAQRMREKAVGELDTRMEAAHARAARDLKRWSRGVEDAFDAWLAARAIPDGKGRKSR